MRNLLLILAVTASGMVYAGDEMPEVTCKLDEIEMLNPAQREAFKSGNRSFSPLVSEILARHQQIPNSSYVGKPTEIDWDQAKKMILWGLIAVTIQGHDSSLIVITHSRKAYRTKQPRLDDVFRVTRVIDPCNRFIVNITE